METMAISWIDNGFTTGEFAVSLADSLLNPPIKVDATYRIKSPILALSRQKVIDSFLDDFESDWLMMLDSDIVLTPEIFKLLVKNLDKEKVPVLCGLYFIFPPSVGKAMPCILSGTSEIKGKPAFIHPYPENELIKITHAGLGITIIHRSAVEKLREKYPRTNIFAEKWLTNNDFRGEDIVFFDHLFDLGIPVFCHTGAKVGHIKTNVLDENVYKSQWWM
jgi:hypothetical protein